MTRFNFEYLFLESHWVKFSNPNKDLLKFLNSQNEIDPLFYNEVEDRLEAICPFCTEKFSNLIDLIITRRNICHYSCLFVWKFCAKNSFSKSPPKLKNYIHGFLEEA